VSHLEDARRAWNPTDSHSREQARGWSPELDEDRIDPADLLPLAASCAPILTRVAHPGPNLRAKTVESFPRLVIGAPSPVPRTPGADPVPADGGSNPASLPAGTDLFDVTKPPWKGDLGRFVADRLATGAKALRVVARGAGTFEMTPVRLPEGSSLTISVAPAAVDRAPALVWKPKAGMAGEALLDAKSADVHLSGVRLILDAPSKVAHLIRMDAGQLVLSTCHFTVPGGRDPLAPLVAFRAAGSRPLPPRPGALYPASDRPVCRLIDCSIVTGGDVLSAEVARGIVALENCAIACGGRALCLRPQAVGRDFFEADLWLDRCTIASERAIVDLGRWDGRDGGPDRPWLISSRRCAFVDAFAGRPKRTPVLQVDPDAFVRGVVFWQADRDALEVARFAATEQAYVPTARGPDVRREWIALWGRNHMVNVQGPVPGDREPIVRLAGDRLKLATLVPHDLAVVLDLRPGRNTQGIGADLTRLHLPPLTRRAGRNGSRVGP
jgi:eukaryotic-like serine/threonine-protein kinase